jgi:hypothetical protein
MFLLIVLFFKDALFLRLIFNVFSSLKHDSTMLIMSYPTIP